MKMDIESLGLSALQQGRQLDSDRQNSGQEGGALGEAAEQFEALLLNELYKVMRRTVPESSMFGQGMAQDLFTGMLDEALAKQSAEGGGFGLADMLMGQLGGDQVPGSAPPHIDRLLQDGNWVQPVDGVPGRLNEAQLFGAERPGQRPEACGEGHCGIDLPKAEGSPVRAVRQGVVVAVGRDEDSAGGLSVTLRHAGGVVTRYLHLAAIEPSIGPGTEVRTGQQIGAVGESGTSSDGVHLHFQMEWHEGSQRRFVDPGGYLERWPKARGEVTFGSR